MWSRTSPCRQWLSLQEKPLAAGYSQLRSGQPDEVSSAPDENEARAIVPKTMKPFAPFALARSWRVWRSVTTMSANWRSWPSSQEVPQKAWTSLRPWFSLLFRNGAPERIRTSDLCLRRAALYPAELRVLRSTGETRLSRREPSASAGDVQPPKWRFLIGIHLQYRHASRRLDEGLVAVNSPSKPLRSVGVGCG